MREREREIVFAMTESERQAYYQKQFVKEALTIAKKQARAYARNVLSNAQSERPEVSLMMCERAMRSRGVKSQLCLYGAHVAMRLIREQGMR